MAGRFIKLYDKILKWEWYSDINTFRLFIHLLLKANYKDLRFEGQTIRRGQLVTSLTGLSAQTGLTVRQLRVSLDKLKMTGEVTSLSCPRYRIITVVKYDEYQGNDKLNDKQMTSRMSAKWQADDKLMTGSMTTSIDNNIEQIEQIEQDRNIESERKTAKRFIPPTKDEIILFCQENGLSVDADRFIDYYTANGWMAGKNHMKNWQATVRNWARRDGDQKQVPVPAFTQRKQVVAQQYEQRDYHDDMDEIMRQQNERIIARLRAEGRTDV